MLLPMDYAHIGYFKGRARMMAIRKDFLQLISRSFRMDRLPGISPPTKSGRSNFGLSATGNLRRLPNLPHYF